LKKSPTFKEATDPHSRKTRNPNAEMLGAMASLNNQNILRVHQTIQILASFSKRIVFLTTTVRVSTVRIGHKAVGSRQGKTSIEKYNQHRKLGKGSASICFPANELHQSTLQGGMPTLQRTEGESKQDRPRRGASRTRHIKVYRPLSLFKSQLSSA